MLWSWRLLKDSSTTKYAAACLRRGDVNAEATSPCDPGTADSVSSTQTVINGIEGFYRIRQNNLWHKKLKHSTIWKLKTNRLKKVWLGYFIFLWISDDKIISKFVWNILDSDECTDIHVMMCVFCLSAPGSELYALKTMKYIMHIYVNMQYNSCVLCNYFFL